MFLGTEDSENKPTQTPPAWSRGHLWSEMSANAHTVKEGLAAVRTEQERQLREDGAQHSRQSKQTV